jgi:SAM-dependent methyltransferase
MIETVNGLNHEEVGQAIEAEYRGITAQYRRDDEIEVESDNHRRLCRTLGGICRSFSHRISALDVGCGTGRFFHCLENVGRLVGIDVCEEMLIAAQHPVREELVTVDNVELVRGNIYLHSFAPGSFDFIYSLGMFGHGCPVSVEVCDRFYEWLAPGGKLFFNVVDLAGLPLWYQARRRLRWAVYPLLPRALREMLDKRELRAPFFGLTQHQLKQVLRKTRFAGHFEIRSQVCTSPLWSGRHLECLAHKA